MDIKPVVGGLILYLYYIEDWNYNAKYLYEVQTVKLITSGTSISAVSLSDTWINFTHFLKIENQENVIFICTFQN